MTTDERARQVEAEIIGKAWCIAHDFINGSALQQFRQRCEGQFAPLIVAAIEAASADVGRSCPESQQLNSLLQATLKSTCSIAEARERFGGPWDVTQS